MSIICCKGSIIDDLTGHKYCVMPPYASSNTLFRVVILKKLP